MQRFNWLVNAIQAERDRVAALVEEHSRMQLGDYFRGVDLGDRAQLQTLDRFLAIARGELPTANERRSLRMQPWLCEPLRPWHVAVILSSVLLIGLLGVVAIYCGFR